MIRDTLLELAELDFGMTVDKAHDLISQEILKCVPGKNNEDTLYEIECDSPEKNQMIGWNECRTQILKNLKKIGIVDKEPTINDSESKRK